MHIGMSHFVYVGNQKSVRIQIRIDGNPGLIVWYCPEIAQSGLARLRNVQVKTVELPKVLAVIDCRRWKVGTEYVCQRLKTKKPYKNKAFY